MKLMMPAFFLSLFSISVMACPAGSKNDSETVSTDNETETASLVEVVRD